MFVMFTRRLNHDVAVLPIGLCDDTVAAVANRRIRNLHFAGAAFTGNGPGTMNGIKLQEMR